MSTQIQVSPKSGITIGTTPITSGVAGRVLFEGAGNVVQESAGLIWDNTNKIFNSIGSIKSSGVVSTTKNIEILYDEAIGSMIRSNLYDSIHLLANTNKLATFQSNGILFPSNSSQLIGNSYRNLIEIFNESTGKLTAKTTNAWNLELGVNNSINQVIFGSTGNIGINTTTDNGGKLQVKAGGALSTDIAFKVRNSADTEDLLSVNGLGNLGLGVTPTTKLDVNGTSRFTGQMRVIGNGIWGANSTNNAGITSIDQNGTSSAARIYMCNAAGNAYPIWFDAGGFSYFNAGNVGVGTNTDIASAQLHVTSTTKGFLPPRMTNTQRLAIATPAVGLIVYCTDSVEGLYVNKSTGWTFII